jgi:hypothetical protein
MGGGRSRVRRLAERVLFFADDPRGLVRALRTPAAEAAG